MELKILGDTAENQLTRLKYHIKANNIVAHDSWGGRYLICIFPRWPPLTKVTFLTFEPKMIEMDLR